MKKWNIILNILIGFIILSYIYAIIVGSPISIFEMFTILLLIYTYIRYKKIEKTKKLKDKK